MLLLIPSQTSRWYTFNLDSICLGADRRKKGLRLLRCICEVQPALDTQLLLHLCPGAIDSDLEKTEQRTLTSIVWQSRFWLDKSLGSRQDWICLLALCMLEKLAVRRNPLFLWKEPWQQLQGLPQQQPLWLGWASYWSYAGPCKQKAANFPGTLMRKFHTKWGSCLPLAHSVVFLADFPGLWPWRIDIWCLCIL